MHGVQKYVPRVTIQQSGGVHAENDSKAAQTQVEVAQTRRKALSVAALVQINVGYQQYLKALDGYHSASELNVVDQSIFKVISDTTESDAGSELERVHAATAALASQLEKEQSLSEIYSALGNIYSSIGLDPVQGNIADITVRTLAVQLEKTLDKWYKGEFPKLPAELNSTPSVSQTPNTSSATVTPDKACVPSATKTTIIDFGESDKPNPASTQPTKK